MATPPAPQTYNRIGLIPLYQAYAEQVARNNLGQAMLATPATNRPEYTQVVRLTPLGIQWAWIKPSNQKVME